MPGGRIVASGIGGSAAEEYRNGRLTKPELRALLGLATGDQIDTFLKAHEVYEEATLEDIENEIEGLKRLGV